MLKNELAVLFVAALLTDIGAAVSLASLIVFKATSSALAAFLTSLLFIRISSWCLLTRLLSTLATLAGLSSLLASTRIEIVILHFVICHKLSSRIRMVMTRPEPETTSSLRPVADLSIQHACQVPIP